MIYPVFLYKYINNSVIYHAIHPIVIIKNFSSKEYFYDNFAGYRLPDLMAFSISFCISLFMASFIDIFVAV